MKYRLIYFLLLGALFFYGCEECPGCEERIKESRVKIRFNATGTLDLTEEQLDSLSTTILQQVELLDSSAFVQKADSINLVLEQLREDSTKLNEWLSLFRTGKTLINSISGDGVSDITVFEDTTITKTFSLPVNMNKDESIYYFSYHDLVDTLKIQYDREIIQTLDGIRMRILELAVDESSTTFDSVSVNCYGSECSNQLSTVDVYF
jgi:hypothetical protein